MAFVQVLQFPKFNTPIKQILPEMFHSGWHKVKTTQNFLYITIQSLTKKETEKIVYFHVNYPVKPFRALLHLL